MDFTISLRQWDLLLYSLHRLGSLPCSQVHPLQVTPELRGLAWQPAAPGVDGRQHGLFHVQGVRTEHRLAMELWDELAMGFRQ